MLVLSEEDKKKIKIFAGPSSEDLAKKVSEDLGMSLNLVKMNRFADGEVFIKPEESVRGCKVFVIQSTSNPLLELLNIYSILSSLNFFINSSSPFFSELSEINNLKFSFNF